MHKIIFKRSNFESLVGQTLRMDLTMFDTLFCPEIRDLCRQDDSATAKFWDRESEFNLYFTE